MTDEQVLDSWEEWCKLRDRDMRVPLWRVLALHDQLSSEDVFKEASLLYAFTESDVSLEDGLA
ncbi:MAG: hypothetical protein O3A57_10840, partial [Bacteroidetes bacterium]|nr:hypothetical protein [Bacteroidota bacterium]